MPRQRPRAPVRVYGNTWHVGPRGLGVFLVTAPTGHVLIDGGVPANAALIEANLRSLGIDLRDVKWILNTHAHCDHAGGLAQLVRDTGAQVVAGAADRTLLARGGRDDPQYGNRFPFPPVRVTTPATDGQRLQLGSLTFTAHATPGHTQGNTTWTSCENDRCLQMADVGSLSAPGYRLLGNARHPGVVQDFTRSFAVVAALPCDIALAPHPGMVDFWERVGRRDRGEPDALVDPALCRAYANEARESFAEEVTRQRDKAAAATRRRP
jgi:metallo-beta-lactamase class B